MIRSYKTLLLVTGGLLLSAFAAYAGPEPVQIFYLPLPEQDIQRTLVELQPSQTIGQSIRSVTSVTTTRDSTILYYDHWENGYEVDIANPVNLYNASNPGGTQIWGDNDPSNGIPPGFVTDIIDADSVIALTNDVTVPRNPSTFYYDARDKIGSTKAVAMTRAEWAEDPGTVLAGAVEVFSVEYLGTQYEFPIGEDLDVVSDRMFQYVAAFVMSTKDGTNITIDVDGPGGNAPVTRVLNAGENYFTSGVQTGGTVTADSPIQVHLITGNLSTSGGRLEARWFTQISSDTWSDEYYCPVGSSGTNQPTRVFLYNPGGSAINVDYETFVSSGTINVGAGAVAEYTMPSNTGAVFVSQNEEPFFGVAMVAAGTNNGGSSSQDNDTWDWGFSLVPESILTPQIVVGWGPGADDQNNNGEPDAQGSPVWVAVTQNTVVYIDYDGDASTGPLTDPNGNKYDKALNMNRFQQAKVYDDSGDNDQTGMKLYTVDGTLITAAWGQDPSRAGAGNPYLDLGTTVPPFPFPQMTKTAAEVAGMDGDGIFEPGDTIEYTIKIKNLGAVSLPDLLLLDELPTDVTYVSSSTTLQNSEAGAVVAIADDPIGSPFPLDGDGMELPTIGRGKTLWVKFRVLLNTSAAGRVVNTAILDIGPELLIADSLSSSSAVEVVNDRVPPDVEFTDDGYTPVSYYEEGDDVYISLDEPDFNIDSVTVDSFTVIVKNDTTGDYELLTLTETGPNTGIFQNTVALPGSASIGETAQDGTLNYHTGDTLSVTVTDPGDPSGSNTDTDTVTVSAPSNAKLLYLADDFGTPVINRTEPSGGSPIELPLGTGVKVVDANYRVNSSSTGNHTMTVPITVSSTANNQIILVSVFYEDDQDTSGGSYAGPDIDVSGVVFDSDSAAPVNATFENEQISTEEATTELWYILNPNPGPGDVEVSIINDTDPGSGFEDSVIVSVIVMSDVDQVAPFGTSIQFEGYDNETAIIGVPSEPGDLVLGLLAVDDQETIQSAPGQVDIFGPVGSEGGGEGLGSPVGESAPVGDGARCIISAKVGPSNASSVDFAWDFPSGSDAYAVVGVAIKADDSVNSALQATSIPFTSPFSMPANGAVEISIFAEVDMGETLTAGDIEASLLLNTTPFFTSTVSTITQIGASGSGPNGGDVYRLDFNGTLSSAVNASPSDTIELNMVNNGTVDFTILYDSSAYNTFISLPATTVVDVESVEFYDAPYPGGSLVTSTSVGDRLYIRTVISDPFGPSDITNPTLQITDPLDQDAFTPDPADLTVVGAQVASDTDSVTYEYVWQTPGIDGEYAITVTAEEGTEGTVTDTLTETIVLTQQDAGTPAFVEFTTGNDGPVTDTYTPSESIGVRLFDFDENEDPGVVETVQVTITTSQGDTDVVTLTETGPDTGIFTALFPSATDSGNGDDGDINAPAGTGLHVSYVDDDDPLDVAEDNAAVPVGTPNTPAVSVNKQIIEPSDGTALVGEQITYSISITNVGSTTLTSTELVDTFVDSELTYVSASIAPDSTSPSGTLTWDDLGALAVGDSVSVSLVFTVNSAGTIDNDADVTATSGFGTALGSDTASLSVTQPGVTVTKTLDGGARTLYYGDLLTYTIEIENTGNVDIETLPLTDNYSTALEFVSATPAADGGGGGVILWNDLTPGAATLDVGNTTSVSVTFKVVGEADPAINYVEIRYATDVNGDKAPPAEDQNTELTADAASISDTIWEDTDGNGTQNGSEGGLSGIRVYLDLDGDGIRDPNEPFDVSDSNGNYRIGNLPEGTYTVRLDANTIDDALSITTPGAGAYSVTLDPGEDDSTVDFGLERTTITGLIFNDVNGNGLTTPDSGENGLGGIDVIITDSNGNTQVVRTLPDGTFTAEVPAGLTWIDVDDTTLPAGYALTTDSATTDNEPQSLTAVPGVNTYTSIGYQQPQGVTGHLFIDTDANGTQDGGEPNLPGVTVFADLDTDGNLDPGEPFTVTDSNGDYTLEIPSTGTISIQVDESTLPSGLDTTPTTANDPQNVSVSGSTLSTASDVGYAFNGLGILKSSDVDTNAEPGDTVTYTINVTNNSGVTQDGIDITDTLPANVTFVPGSLEIDAPANVMATVNITDNFDSQDESGGSPMSVSGSLGWVGDWIEVNEANGFSNTEVAIIYDSGASSTDSWSMHVENGADFGPVGARRALDLSAASSATIDYTIRRVSLNFPDDNVEVQISPDGSSWTTLAIEGGEDTQPGYADDNDYVDQGSPITIGGSFLTSTAQIRLLSQSTLENGDWVNFDDFVISATQNISQTGAPGNFPSNNELALGYVLEDGQSITITYEVTVDASHPGGSLANTASVQSNQTGLTNSTVTDTVVIPPSTGSIAGTVKADTDGDGIGNQPIENVRLELRTSGGAQIDANSSLPGIQPTYAYTNADGEYSFDDLDDGVSYQVWETQPSGYVSVATTTPNNPDSPDVNVLGDDYALTVTGDTINSGNNFVEQQPATISGYVLEDFDGNGSGDIGIGGITVELLDATGTPIDSDNVTAGVQPTVATTNASGFYSFNNLTPGVTYQVRQTVQPSGYTSVSDSDGGNANLIGDVTPITTVAGANPGNNFIEELIPGSISGTVYDDTDGNGTGDTGIDGVTVYLDLNNNGTYDAGFDTTTTTSGGGNYSFTGLRNGTYHVREVDPGGYVSVSDSDGGDANHITVSLGAGVNSTGNDFIDGVPGTISGTVIDDANSNGVNDSESGIDGVTVEIYVDDNANGQLDFGEVLYDTTTTSGGGNFSFSVPAGDYVIVETDPPNYYSTADSDAPNNNEIAASVMPSGTSSGHEFLDANAGVGLNVTKSLNGGVQTLYYGDTATYTIQVQNLGNTAITTLPLLDTFDSSVLQYQSATVIPDLVDGNEITWDNLGPLSAGQSVSIEVTFVVVRSGTDVENIASVTGAFDEYGTPVPDDSDNDIQLTADTASISGSVWDDTDGDGVFDGGESGFGNTRVYLDLDGNGSRGVSEPSVLTNSSGDYLFSDLDAGSYTVRVDRSGALTNPPSDYISTTVASHSVVLTDGQDSTGNDFGFGPQAGDLTIVKTSDAGASVNPGDTVTYTVTVTNTSTDTLTGVDVTDVVPEGTSYVAASVNVDAPAYYIAPYNTVTITDPIDTVGDGTTGTPTSGTWYWNSDWIEVGESGGFGGGDIQIMNDGSTVALRLRDNQNGGEGAQRLLNLSGATIATLSLEYRRNGLDNGNDYVDIDVSNNGSSWTNLATIDGSTVGTDANYQNLTVSIPASFLTSTARIRLRTSPNMGNNDQVWFDSVTIVASDASFVNITENWSSNNYSGGSPISSGDSIGWDANWTEIGDNGASGSGEILIDTESGGNAIHIQGPSNGIYRAFDLTRAAEAFLDYDFLRLAIEDSGEYVDVQIASSTSGPWTTLETHYGTGTDDSSFQTQPTISIPSQFLGDVAYLRFYSNNTFNALDELYIDNIAISCIEKVPQPGTPGAPSAIATDYALDGGEVMTITYQVLVDDYPGVSVVENTAIVTSDQEPGPFSSTVFDPVDVGAISGYVLQDTNGDGIGDVPITGNTLELQLDDGTQIDTDPDTVGIQPPIATTNGFGAYVFENVPVGDYRVVQLVQPAGLVSTSDTDGFNDTVNNMIGDETAITVTSGVNVSDNDFIESEVGTVEGYVYEDLNFNGAYNGGEPGIESVTIDLILDKNGNGQIDLGDIVFENAATTNSSGFFQFTNVPVGNYLIKETDPAGYISTGDSVSPNNNVVTGITVTNGGTSSGHYFLDANLSNNGDNDCRSDVLEYALSGDLDSGAVNATWPKLQLVNTATGRFDFVFTRPVGIVGVSYTLQGSNSLIGTWFDIASIAANAAAASPFSVHDNGNSTETITYGNVQSHGSYATPSFGLVRLKIETGEGEHYTAVWGWEKTVLTQGQCNSYGNPFSLQEVFCGGVTNVSGAELTISSGNGTDFSSFLAGANYYVEVTDGDNEGARFQIASGGVNTITVYNDSDVYSPTGVDSLNTRTGVPADLLGDAIKIVRYRTVGEFFNPATTFSTQADANGANAAHSYIYNNRADVPMYDAMVLVDIPAEFAPFYTYLDEGKHWVLESEQGDLDAQDQGSRLVDPQTGFLVIPKPAPTASPTLYAYGVAREHDADLVLNSGFNLVCSLYPLDQVPIDDADQGDDGQDLTTTNFTGGTAPTSSTEIILWHTDPEVEAFDSTVFMLLDTDDAWIDYAEVGAPPFTNFNDEPATLLFQSNRARFIKLPASDQTIHLLPEPTE